MDIFSNSIIAVIISLALIYALLSILVSILVEWWNHFTKERGKQLKKAINQLLDDRFNMQYGLLVYEHPMVAGSLNQETKRPPQYLSSAIFAEVFVDIICNQAKTGVVIKRKKSKEGKISFSALKNPTELTSSNIMEHFAKGVESMNESPFKEMLYSFVLKSEGDHERLQKILENWYNSYMERVSGWYKRKQTTKFIIMGFVVAFSFNVDSIHLFKILSLDDELRSKMEMAAENITDQYTQLDVAERSSISMQLKLMEEAFKENDSETFNSDYFAKMESLLAKGGENLRKLYLLDSIQHVRFEEAQRLINLSGSLGIPVGWSCEEAPLSWIPNNLLCRYLSNGEQLFSSANTIDKVVNYVTKRNSPNPGPKLVTLYILGMFISGLSLSFGAPFWFDALTKLVNIRRSGTKPSTKQQA